MARTTTATDNFTRADNTDLGANWDTYTTWFRWGIVGNRARPSELVTGDNVESYNAVSLANDQWCELTAVTWNTSAFHNLHAMCRMPAPNTRDGYSAYMANTANLAGLSKFNAGAWTQLTSVSYTPSAGVRNRLECVGTGLTCYGNDVSLSSTTDSDFASGRAGIGSYIEGSVANLELSLFEAGEFSAAAGPTPHFMHYAATRNQ